MSGFSSWPVLLSCCGFMLASSITPGPNNALLLSSGLRFGVRRSMRHLMGIQFGFALLLAAAASGLLGVLQTMPGLQRVLQVLSVAYLLWMAWGMVRAPGVNPAPLASAAAPGAEVPGVAQARPMGFFAAMAFQWINPKAWVMAVTALSLYLPPSASGTQLLAFCLLFFLLGLPCSTLWLAGGHWLRHGLQDPRRQQRFQRVMGLALAASVLPVLI